MRIMKLNLANVLVCQSTYFRHLLMKFAWVVGALGEALGFLYFQLTAAAAASSWKAARDVWPPLQ